MKLVKLTQITVIGDKSEIRFQLIFPKSSNGSELLLEFIKQKKEYFRGNPAFDVDTTYKIPENQPAIEFTVIKMNWIREVAQECHHFISNEIKIYPDGLQVQFQTIN